MKFKHTNLIARDWQSLACFYEEVFDCRRVPPERHLSGDWLERGTGVQGAAFSGVHLQLPGCGEPGPTLEIYQYAHTEPKPAPAANREGFGHLAFEVGDVEQVLREVLAHGGRSVGAVVSRDLEGIGRLTFVYAADPEGNILELQSWRQGNHEITGRRS
jgi:catechol 2,3-dioxygenase-like lactoylglutathione lyase family enzyme